MIYADRDLSDNQPTSAMNATKTITLTTGPGSSALTASPMTATSASNPKASMPGTYPARARIVNSAMHACSARMLV